VASRSSQRANCASRHTGYEFTPQPLPVPAVEESVAEKLAAWLRRRKMRDLYDLYWYGSRAMDEALVRRLFVLKVWHDVVRDGLGTGPLDPARITAAADRTRIAREDIGLLTQPVQPDVWLASIRRRYAFAASHDNDETRVARCSPADAYFVAQLVSAMRSQWDGTEPK
jgi:predicted nucleotidyltransferase component of viral defense system